jgi:hypothetical protein
MGTAIGAVVIVRSWAPGIKELQVGQAAHTLSIFQISKVPLRAGQPYSAFGSQSARPGKRNISTMRIKGAMRNGMMPR